MERAAAGVLPEDDLQRARETLRHNDPHLGALALILIVEIGSLDTGMLPRRRETGADDALAIERLGNDAEESLNQRTAADADTVAEITIALPSGSVVVADLSEIGGALAVVHLIEDVGLHQPVAIFCPSCLEIGQCRMHHLGGSHVVDAPRVGHPVAGGDRVIARLLHFDMRDVTVDILCSEVCLLRTTGAAVYRRIDAPHGWMVVAPAQSHRVLILRPYTLPGNPQPLVQGFQDLIGLPAIGRRVFADHFRDTRRQPVAAIVIGGAMGDGTAAIVERVAGPDAAIGIIEMVAVGVEIALLPCQMA